MGGSRRNRVVYSKVAPCSASAGLSLGPLVVLLLCFCATGAEEKRAITSWADKWCELNDCLGVQERQRNSAASEWIAKEERKAVRRYKATGEIRAIKTAMVHQSTFQYDGPTIDHPAFPGVSRELAEKKERKDENFAIEARKQASINAANPSQPAGGYLLPGAKAAQELAVSNPEDASAAVSRRRHQKMKEEVRMSCMYDYGKEKLPNGMYKHTSITTMPTSVKGCAAGSVWHQDASGGVSLASRTAESMASVWRKINGTEREWFEDVYMGEKGQPWVKSKKQIIAEQKIPFKRSAPPPCAPGYGGAFCKKELGTGGDYVDEEDQPPTWANMKDVARLKAFWKEQHALAVGAKIDGVDLSRHEVANALPLAPHAFTAGTAQRGIAAGEEKPQTCSCDPTDHECILKCTEEALVVPKSCYQKCDSSGCFEECVHVDITMSSGEADDAKKPAADEPAAAPEEIPAAPSVAGISGGTGSFQGGVKAEKTAKMEQIGSGRSAGGGGNNETDGGGIPEDACPPGEVSETGRKPCKECPAGSFSGKPGGRQCERCPQGSFSNGTGATECSHCGGNSSTARVGASSEKDCGAFAHVTGVQTLSYEQKHDSRVVLDGSSGDDSWRPVVNGGASGPWYGGWWIAVHGKNLGKGQGDIESVSVGDVECKKSVWLSESSVACMTPRGMGSGLSVTVGLKSGAATVKGKFSYSPPIIESYHPRGGAPRGGFWVTVTGRNFGHVDTKPTVYLAGRICLESYWVSDSKVMCRGPPGVGGHSMLHTVDMVLEATEHVQEMPRRLRQWVKSVLGSRSQSVPQYKPPKDGRADATVLIDAKASKQSSSALVSSEGDGATLEERRKKWAEKEKAVKQEIAQIKERKADVDIASIATYLSGAEERASEAEQREDEERAKRIKEVKEREELEARQRAEDEAALEASKRREEEAKKGSAKAKDKLDKFQAAKRKKEQARHAAEAAELLKAASSCLSLMTLVCEREGVCKYATSAALTSPGCEQAKLNRTGASVEAAGMEGTDDGKKVLALLWERRQASEKAANFTRDADVMLQANAATKLDAASRAVLHAEDVLKAAGIEFGEQLKGLRAKVDELVERRRIAKEEEEAAKAKERASHLSKGGRHMEEAEAFLKKGEAASARASHGSAKVEYELAGAVEEMAGALERLMNKVEEGEAAEEAARKKAAEQARLAEEERVKQEDERKKAEEEKMGVEAAAQKAAAESAAAALAEAEAEKELTEQNAQALLRVALDLAAKLPVDARQGEAVATEAELAAVFNAADAAERAFKEAGLQGSEELSKAKLRISKLREMNAKLAREAELKEHVASKAETAGSHVDGGDVVAAEKAAAEKAAAEKAAAEKAAAAKAAAEKAAAEKAAAAKAAAEKAAAAKAAADKAAAEKAAAEKAAAEKAAAGKAPSKGKGTIGLGVKAVIADGKQTGLTVTRLVSGGASERSGKISVGHSLATVDGVDVSMMAIKDLAVKALAGDAGTSVVLGLKDDAGRAYTIELVRDPA